MLPYKHFFSWGAPHPTTSEPLPDLQAVSLLQVRLKRFRQRRPSGVTISLGAHTLHSYRPSLVISALPKGCARQAFAKLSAITVSGTTNAASDP